MNFFKLSLFHLLYILPLLVLGVFFIYKNILKNKQFNTLGLAKMRSYRFDDRFHKLRFIFLGLCLLLLFVSVLRPVWGANSKTSSAQGVDVVFTLDVSQSMRALDVGNGSTDRLTLAKAMINKFSTLHPENRYGLVIFAGEAFVSTPLTADIDAFLTFLDGVSYNDVGTQGTNINEALKASIDRFYSEKDKERGRAVVIISDGGEEMDGDIAGFAKLSRSFNIKIFAVGIGSSDGVPIPDSTDMFGKVTHKQYQGKTVLTKLNEKILKQIASETSGEYFHAEEEKDLEKIIGKLKTLQTTSIKTEGNFGREDRFQYFLFPAFIFFLLFLFSDSEDEIFELLKKIVNNSKKILKISVPLFIILLLSSCVNSDITFRYYNSQGNQKFTKSYYKEAISEYLKASDSSSKLKYISDNNFAVSEYATSDYEKALKKLEVATVNYCGDKKEEFCDQLFYNLGNIYYRLGETKKYKEQSDLWQKAIDAYKKDLEINSADKDAQENIDFITKKMKQEEEKKSGQNKDSSGGEKNTSDSKDAQSQTASSTESRPEGADKKDGENSGSESGQAQNGNLAKESESENKTGDAEGASPDDQSVQTGQTAKKLDEQTNQQVDEYMKAIEDREKGGQDNFKQNPNGSFNNNSPFDDFFNSPISNDPFFQNFFGGGFDGNFNNKPKGDEKDW